MNPLRRRRPIDLKVVSDCWYKDLSAKTANKHVCCPFYDQGNCEMISCALEGDMLSGEDFDTAMELLSPKCPLTEMTIRALDKWDEDLSFDPEETRCRDLVVVDPKRASFLPPTEVDDDLDNHRWD